MQLQLPIQSVCHSCWPQQTKKHETPHYNWLTESLLYGLKQMCTTAATANSKIGIGLGLGSPTTVSTQRVRLTAMSTTTTTASTPPASAAHIHSLFLLNSFSTRPRALRFLSHRTRPRALLEVRASSSSTSPGKFSFSLRWCLDVHFGNSFLRTVFSVKLLLVKNLSW